MSNQRVLVIGGGVIGANCAYFLSRAGYDVTIVDRGEFGKGCSHGNCGFISPSHVLPLAAPGAAKNALLSMLKKNSPFHIKPRLDPSLWMWLLRFARRCNRESQMESARAIYALLHSSRELYEELAKNELSGCEWEARGVLFVFRSREEFEHYGESAARVQEEFGLPVERIESEKVCAFEPAIKCGVAAGAWFQKADAHLRPDKMMKCWRGALDARGVKIIENCDVNRWRRENGRAVAALTSNGEISADYFVLAAGALTPMLKNELGCKIPIQPGKGYSMTMPRPARCPQRPIIFEEDRVAVTPMQSGFRLGSIMEFAGYDSSMRTQRFDLLRNTAQRYLHDPCCEQIEEQWCGWRPMTHDSRPIIGASPAMSNLFIAAGHNMLGVSMGPGTGKLVAEMIRGQSPHIDPAPYSPLRF